MSSQEAAQSPAGNLDEVPRFELECLFDDMEDPSELTIFTPRGSATATEWITIDYDRAVSLDGVQ